MIEMVFWFWGLYALLSGSMRIFGGLQYDHLPARVVGVFFMLPLPISFYLPAFLNRIGVPNSERRFFFLFFELLVLAVFVGGGLLVGAYLRSRRGGTPANENEA